MGISSYQKILSEFTPDILHVFGTESEKTLKLIELFGNPDRTIIHLQGIELAQSLSSNAIASQTKMSDRHENRKRLLDIYGEVLSE